MSARKRRVDVAQVYLWGQLVGAVAWNGERGAADFEYAPDFIQSGLNIAPITMPLARTVYTFPEISRQTFYGLPGLLADALPDRFGNNLIALWLARQGRSVTDFSPVERLCYMGTRAMGALEFRPALEPRAGASVPVEVSDLVDLAARMLGSKEGFAVNLAQEKEAAVRSIIRVGTSAGGNRAKAVIAWNPETGEVRSGQVNVPDGFEPWILKFDGVNDQLLGDPQGFGRVEYAYHLMAVAAGIRMNPCRLFEEGGRAHFMTRRFDRDRNNQKIHMQSLCALAHYDFNAAGAHGYEQAFNIILRLNLGHDVLQEMYRRMVFNVLARNQDDHTRNIAFLMGQDGLWQMAPAFDLVWAYNPAGSWTNRHQLSVNGKRDGFSASDLVEPAEQFDIRHAQRIRKEVAQAVAGWEDFAQKAGVTRGLFQHIATTHRNGLV